MGKRKGDEAIYSGHRGTLPRYHRRHRQPCERGASLWVETSWRSSTSPAGPPRCDLCDAFEPHPHRGKPDRHWRNPTVGGCRRNASRIALKPCAGSAVGLSPRSSLITDRPPFHRSCGRFVRVGASPIQAGSSVTQHPQPASAHSVSRTTLLRVRWNRVPGSRRTGAVRYSPREDHEQPLSAVRQGRRNGGQERASTHIHTLPANRSQVDRERLGGAPTP